MQLAMQTLSCLVRCWELGTHTNHFAPIVHRQGRLVYTQQRVVRFHLGAQPIISIEEYTFHMGKDTGRYRDGLRCRNLNTNLAREDYVAVSCVDMRIRQLLGL